ncbi:MAG: LD-carboxypeptidase [Rickettsiales bacterium]|nr:MAG: LD-carboxypeptidase [Rickettsiales bacterium]
MIKFDREKDKVAIIAPASGANDDDGVLDVEKSMEKLGVAMNLFQNAGFRCEYDDKIFAGDSLGYFAAPRAERLRQLKNALEDPEVKIISAFRGGYGCSEIVFDCLDVNPSGAKILIGFSDITVLHFLFNQHYNFPSIHTLVNDSYKHMFGDVLSVLSGGDITLDLTPLNDAATSATDALVPSTTTAISAPAISAEMLGGNMTLICSLLGTKLHPNISGKILFIEDVNEKGYRIHRSLMHMHNAGLFKEAAAVIFGDFTKADKHAEATLRVFSAEYLGGIAAYKTTGIGHGRVSHPITIGGSGKIEGNQLVVSSSFELI